MRLEASTGVSSCVENPCPPGIAFPVEQGPGRTECCRHRGVVERPERAPQKTRSFPGGLRAPRRGGGGDTAGHTCSQSAHSRTLAHAPRTHEAHSAGLVPAPKASRARPSCRCSRRAASKRDRVAAGGPRGRAGG